MDLRSSPGRSERLSEARSWRDPRRLGSGSGNTFTNDIKDINQGTSYPQVMNKQVKGRGEILRLSGRQKFQGCVREGVDTDGIAIEVGPVRMESKFPTRLTLPQTHKYLLGGPLVYEAFTFTKDLLCAPPSAWQNLARFGSYMLIKQGKMVFQWTYYRAESTAGLRMAAE